MVSILFLLEYSKLHVLMIHILGYNVQRRSRVPLITTWLILLFADVLHFVTNQTMNLYKSPISSFMFVGFAILLLCYITKSFKHFTIIIVMHMMYSFFDFLIFTVLIKIFGYSLICFSNFVSIALVHSLSLVLICIIWAYTYKTKTQFTLPQIPNYIQAIFAIVLVGFGFKIILIKGSVYFSERWYSSIIYAVVFTGGVLILVIMCILLYKNQTIYRSRKYMEIYEENIRNIELYYRTISKQDEETRKFRHDIQCHLQNMYTLLQEKNFVNLEEYIKEINQDVVEINQVLGISTGIRTIDASLYGMKLKYPLVNVSWEGHLIDTDQISKKELSLLITNLLSNGFSAAEKSLDSKYIHIHVKQNEHDLYIRVENSYHYKPIIYAGSMVSDNSDDQNHGYGIQIIKNITKSYNGKLMFEVTDNVVISEVVIVLP